MILRDSDVARRGVVGRGGSRAVEHGMHLDRGVARRSAAGRGGSRAVEHAVHLDPRGARRSAAGRGGSRAVQRGGLGRWAPRAADRGVAGQALLLVVGGLCGILVGALVIGAVAAALGSRADAQRAADLAALAGARAMLDAYPRRFTPATLDGRPNPQHLTQPAYLALGREAAQRVAGRNGGGPLAIEFPAGDDVAPVRIRVRVQRELTVRDGPDEATTRLTGDATAQLAPVVANLGPSAAGGEYTGRLAYRQGKPMRPDVARAFDRMAAAAQADGVRLVVNSGFRSDAEQAILFAAHPDPKWVARPGTSLHRKGTELDLGPPAAYGWLQANATRFHFVQRYSWEPWHWGITLNAGSSAIGDGDGGLRTGVPPYVPARFRAMLSRAAQRWNVSATLLAAQIAQESGFDPDAVSDAGAQGISQFMPGTAAAYGLDDPTNPAAAIDAQARLMRDLLRQFAAVPLALAAYNAGPAPVAACMCVPQITETQDYVAAILGRMGGAGEVGGGLTVRLVR